MDIGKVQPKFLGRIRSVSLASVNLSFVTLSLLLPEEYYYT